MQKKRFLTKSRFQLAIACPAKLFYTGKPEYANQKVEDSFLLALAEGGFQVGSLAKRYFPRGHDITTLNYKSALNQTDQLLKKEDVTIYEAAISVDNLFVRADILVKNKNQIDLIEVKAKSFDNSDGDPFLNNKGHIRSIWIPYLYDIAFQKYVATQAFPEYDIHAYLMMADKNAECPTDGLNQKFRIIKDDQGRKSVSVSDKLSDEDLSTPILCQINVDAICDKIYDGTDTKDSNQQTFAKRIKLYADHYSANKKIVSPISIACGNCEFFATKLDQAQGKKCGKFECWSANLGWSQKEFNQPTIFDIWNFRKKGQLIDAKKIEIEKVNIEDISPKTDNKPGLSPSERQWLQVKKYKMNDDSVWIDYDNLAREMASWKYPLNFIDFETTMVAIPFNKGRHPYEGIAFQFSHHVVYEDGQIEHYREYLNTEPGFFPNYDFLRNLKNALCTNNGSIFRYSNHENTFLNIIYNQLMRDPVTVPDRDDLYEFIRSITHSVKGSDDQWVGERDMIDMLEIVKRYYFDPMTNGSNSIKHVLPSILNRSKYLQNKYSQPIYGAFDGIKSLNFTNWKWIEFKNGKVVDPYKRLPKMFQDVSDKNMILLSDDDELRDGGAALTAYTKLQFEEMSDYERKEIQTALLKYCELDTMAMVMLYEGWKDFIPNKFG